MSELSQIKHAPSSSTPVDNGSAAAPVAPSASSKIKPGNWGVQSFSDLDKKVTEDLVAIKNASQKFRADLLSARTPAQVREAAEKLMNARDQLRDDVTALVAASPPEYMTLTDADAKNVGGIIIANHSDTSANGDYPETHITDAVNFALAQRAYEK